LLLAQAGFNICGTSERLAGAEEALLKAAPDAAVLDIVMSGEESMGLIARLREIRQDLPVIVFSAHENPLYAERAFAAGAMAYVVLSELLPDAMQAENRLVALGTFVAGFAVAYGFGLLIGF
jgi:DNA-binding NarL/FixJ family response regulator